MLALAFFAAVATLVPLGVGSDLRLLARIAAGVLWVAAVLASLLALDRLFQADFEDGSLDVIALSPLSLETISFAKTAAHWLTTGLPLTILSPLLAVSVRPARARDICALCLAADRNAGGQRHRRRRRKPDAVDPARRADPAADRAAAARTRRDLRRRRRAGCPRRLEQWRAAVARRVLLRRLRAFALCHSRRGQAQSGELGQQCSATPTRYASCN